jgi:hypothetical protein
VQREEEVNRKERREGGGRFCFSSEGKGGVDWEVTGGRGRIWTAMCLDYDMCVKLKDEESSG